MFTYFYHQAGLLHFLHFCGLFGGFFSPVCICGNGRKAQGFHKSLASVDQSICKLQDDQFAYVCIVPATQIQSGLLCKQTTGYKRCKPDKKQSFNAHEFPKFMQCRALVAKFGKSIFIASGAIGGAASRSSCLSFSGVVLQVTSRPWIPTCPTACHFL